MITIIIPVYNVEKYIAQCIRSVCKQTYGDLEILLIDDGSTDLSGQICDEFSKRDERIKVFHQSNKGVSAARNFGLKKARGEYIGFVDADDWIDEEMYEHLKNVLIEYEADVASCAFDYYHKGRTKRWEFAPILKKEYTANRAIRELNMGSISGAIYISLYRREVLEGIEFPLNITIGEDYNFTMQVFSKIRKLVADNEAKYHYRRNPESVCNKGFSEKSRNNLDNYRMIYVKYSQLFPDTEEALFAYYYLQKLALIISMIKANHYDKKMLCVMRKEIRKDYLRYVRIKEIPLIYKICASFVGINEYILIIPYRIFIHPWRRA